MVFPPQNRHKGGDGATKTWLGGCSGTETTNNNNTTNNTTNNNAGPTCDPGCDADACQICQVDGTTAVCASVCGAGLTCEAGQCLPPKVSSCDPACDANACLVCDTSGAAPMCRTACADGLTCDQGVCQPPVVTSACDPACGPCQLCDASGDAAACVDRCDADEACNETTNTCVRAGFHANFEDMDGPFPDGPSVTQVCVSCHLDAAEHVINGPHYRWKGPTPNLQGSEPPMTSLSTMSTHWISVTCPPLVVSNPRRCGGTGRQPATSRSAPMAWRPLA